MHAFLHRLLAILFGYPAKAWYFWNPASGPIGGAIFSAIIIPTVWLCPWWVPFAVASYAALAVGMSLENI